MTTMNIKKQLAAAAIVFSASTSYATTTTDVICSYAPSQSVAVNRITAGVGGAGLGAAAILKATGLTMVAHSSGAYILTGSGGYVAGTLLSPLAAPLLVTASVLVGGTAVALQLSCAPKNHPDAVKSVANATEAFNNAVRSTNARAVVAKEATVNKVLELNANAVVEKEAIAARVRSANERAIEVRDGAARLIAGYF
jgi:hypothetical protein